MMLAPKIRGLQAGTLALCAAALLAGCESGPAPAADAGVKAKVQADPAMKVDVSNVTPLDLRDTASAEMGGPETYTLTLVRSADDLPAAVTEQGLDVDFDVHDVILIGMGSQPTSGYRVEITAAQQVGQHVFVQAAFDHPAPDAMVNQVITQPWAAATVYKRKPDVTLRSDFD
jgi:hypothetical protein